MLEHHRYLGTDLVGDVRSLPKGKRLWSSGFEWSSKKNHRINMGVEHDLCGSLGNKYLSKASEQ